jgi:glyoxylase-like metal-dependent hydrolase (beta-lactamase superfamily II)
VQIGSFDDGGIPPLSGEVGEVGVPQVVADGVWRIPLPVPFAPGTVNVTLLHGDDAWVLVDCGLGTPDSDAALAGGLAALGITISDLAALVLTHAHPDHIGPAGDLIAQMPPTASIFMLADEATRMLRVWGERDFTAMAAAQERSGLSTAQAAMGVRIMQRLADSVRLPPSERIVGLHADEEIALAGRQWRVIWTPGHAEGHICLASDPLVIVGDHILPTISPNIGFFAQSRRDPIGDYLDGLDRIAALGFAAPLALPGHGAHFTGLVTRIAALRMGTERRSGHARAALANGPAHALTVTQRLFADRLREPADVWLALGETVSHLEHLVAIGQATCASRDGITFYSGL